MSSPSPVARAILCLLAGHLLLGLAHVAMLPAWEGFDEVAHYSYIQQLADRWEIPRLSTARISTDVERYVRIAPLPYEFETRGGITYRSFFAESDEHLAGARAFVHGRPEQPRRYAAGGVKNWQAQHPPLYYLVLSPVYGATRHLSWAAHLFTLRLASYVLAWAALVIGVYACLTAVPSTLGGTNAALQWAALGIGLWPLVLASWFPEMARLGNDSLSALILAGVWWLTIRAVQTGLSAGYALTLGALLGAGCLTKVFFVPVTVACLGFWSLRAWIQAGPRGLVSIVPRFTIVLLVIGVVAGWWYGLNWQEYGVPFGGMEMIELRRKGGLLSGLARNFSLLGWIKVPAVFMVTLTWPATWSLVGPPLAYLAPIGFTVVLTAGAYAAALWRFPATAAAWLPAWLGGSVVAGFGYHALVRMALMGKGQAGYYLHFLAVALGVALGLGLGAWWARGGFRVIVAVCVAYAVLFAAVISWAQVLLFSGLLFKTGDDNIHVYHAPAAIPAGLGLPEALTRLAVLAYPWVGTIAWVLGGLVVLVGLVWSWRAAHALERPMAPTGSNG